MKRVEDARPGSGRSWPAPAKLNLFLQIVGRRDDGYHELQTVFQLLDYGDALDFTVREDGDVLRHGNDGIAAADDICVRAGHLLKQVSGSQYGVDIHISKRLPIGGGLGGGSSDAATTLRALNRLWSLGLSVDELCAIGLRLGADVPVFVRGRTAWAEGVGERLTPVALPPRWFVVIVPPISVSTAAVFARYKLTPDTRPITIRDFLAGRGRNDLEELVRKIYPDVDAALRWLGRYGAARMTGTGSSVFLAVESASKGREILDRRPATFKGFVAQGIDVHPLLES